MLKLSLLHANIIQNIHQKLSNNNLILSKADKGNSIVILDKSNYLVKVNDFINNGNISELKSDPTPSFQLKLRLLLKNCETFINKKKIGLNLSIPIPQLQY